MRELSHLRFLFARPADALGEPTEQEDYQPTDWMKQGSPNWQVESSCQRYMSHALTARRCRRQTTAETNLHYGTQREVDQWWRLRR